MVRKKWTRASITTRHKDPYSICHWSRKLNRKGAVSKIAFPSLKNLRPASHLGNILEFLVTDTHQH